ncbi:MAG: hypothetical protein MI861_03430, partial [Pirellulales bacterium]|nr:hypothetical protein [Pirellulales bacterium]
MALTSTTIRTGTFEIDADADSADLYDDQDPDQSGNFGEQTAETLSEFFGSLSIFAGFAISKGRSVVKIDGGTIDSANLTITSTAQTQAITRALSPVFGAAALGISKPYSEIIVSNGAKLRSSGNVVLKSLSDADLTVSTYLRGKKLGGSLAFGFIDLDSKATTSANSSIEAVGTIDVTAHGTKTHEVTSTGAAFLSAKQMLAVAYSQALTDVLASVNGTVKAGGNVTIDSRLFTDTNDVAAWSNVGVGGLFGLGVDAVRSRPKLTRLNKVLRWFTGHHKGAGRTTDFGLSGSFAVAKHINDVQSRVEPGATVISTSGDVDLKSQNIELPRSSSQSTVNNKIAPLSGKIISDTRDNSLSLAFLYGEVDNTVKATIGDGAIVMAGRDLEMVSSSEIPWEQQWWTLFPRETPTGEVDGVSIADVGLFVLGKINYNLGIQDGFFTSWAEAYAASKKRALGVQVNILEFDNDSEASIGRNAQITVGRDASIVSKVENDSVNFAGQFGFFQSGAITSDDDSKGIGGSLLRVAYDNDTTAEIKSGANVSADSLLVMGRSDSRNISIATQGGK